MVHAYWKINRESERGGVCKLNVDWIGLERRRKQMRCLGFGVFGNGGDKNRRRVVAVAKNSKCIEDSVLKIITNTKTPPLLTFSSSLFSKTLINAGFPSPWLSPL